MTSKPFGTSTPPTFAGSSHLPRNILVPSSKMTRTPSFRNPPPMINSRPSKRVVVLTSCPGVSSSASSHEDSELNRRKAGWEHLDEESEHLDEGKAEREERRWNSLTVRTSFV